MTKAFVIIASMLTFQCEAHAQAPIWKWAVAANDDGAGTGTDIKSDAQGNVYVLGFFTGHLTLDTLSFYSASDSRDILLSKFDKEGRVLWAKRYGGNRDDAGYGLAVDDDGSIFIAGTFLDSTTIGSSHLTSYGNTDIFVARLDSLGAVIWAKKSGSAYPDHLGYWHGGLAIDHKNGVYITGSFDERGGSPPSQDTMHFGPYGVASTGDDDIFLASYSKNGSEQWIKKAGGVYSDNAYGITVDKQSNIYVTGDFSWPDAFFDSIKVKARYGIFGDVFVAKYDSSGKAIWVNSAGGHSYSEGIGIAVDDTGNTYLTGGYSDDIYFGGNNYFTTPNATFLAKYDSHGALVWVKSSGYNGPNSGQGICLDSSGYPLVVGTFSGVNIFDNTTLVATGPSELFVVKYDPGGNAVWAKQTVGAGNVLGYGIISGRGNDIFVTGNFKSKYASFDQHSIENGGDADMYVAKLSPLATNIQTIPTPSAPLLFPVPVDRQLNVLNAPQNGWLYIIANVEGQVVKTEILSSSRIIDVSQFANGLYYITFTRNGLFTAAQKLIILR